MSKQTPIEILGALPPSKILSTAQPLKPQAAPAISSSARHVSHSTTKPQKSSLLSAPPSKPSDSHPPLNPPKNTAIEPPQRLNSLRPDVSPAEPVLTATEADELCSAICARIWSMNLGDMFDKVLVADRRGHVDDKLYSHLLDFFYCFVPMVVVAPRSDPVVVRAGDLGSHRRIMIMFGPGRKVHTDRGPHRSHQWFSRPKKAGFLRFLFG